MEKRSINSTIIKGQSLVFLWPLFWVVTPPPSYDHAVGTWRPVKNRKRKKLKHFLLHIYETIKLIIYNI